MPDFSQALLSSKAWAAVPYLAIMVELLFFCCRQGGRRMSSAGSASTTMTVMSSL